jgi:hypothetical protein
VDLLDELATRDVSTKEEPCNRAIQRRLRKVAARALSECSRARMSKGSIQASARSHLCSPRLLGSQELEPGARSHATLLNISGENFGETALAAEP